jgi:elongation factor 1-alpha
LSILNGESDMAKEMINVVFSGHVDHGKSTLVGRLFCDLGLISPQALDRLKRHADAIGMSSFYLAYFSDTSLAERERGITIEASFQGFETDSKRFNIIDAPGHKDFIRNMISGATMADVAVLVLDAASTSEQGAAPQTKEHLVLIKAFGIKHLIVAVNKMDVVGFSEEAFEYCKLIIEEFSSKISYKPDGGTIYVPISAFDGDNVVKRSEKIPWYKGPTLLGALESIPPATRFTDLPLRMPILRIFSIPGIGPVAAGRIETGTIKPGDSVVIAPYPGTEEAKGDVRSIEWRHKQIESASAGDDVGVLLSTHGKGFMPRLIKKGAVLGPSNDPPKAAQRFQAQILVINHPSSIRKGYAPYLHVHQAAMPCAIEEIIKIIDQYGEVKFPKKHGLASEEEISLVNGDTGIVWIRPERPLVIEKFDRIPQLGQFALRDSGTVAVGTCIDVQY